MTSLGVGSLFLLCILCGFWGLNTDFQVSKRLYHLSHVGTSIEMFACDFYLREFTWCLSHFRDVSFNELTSFPTEGLNGLNQLKLVGNFQLKDALAARDFANLRCVLPTLPVC